MDINECLAKTHDCGPSEYCINQKGDYDCICDDFTIRIEGKCIDIDECIINDPCNQATRLGVTTPVDLIHRRCANIEGPPGKGVLDKCFLSPDSLGFLMTSSSRI